MLEMFAHSSSLDPPDFDSKLGNKQQRRHKKKTESCCRVCRNEWKTTLEYVEQVHLSRVFLFVLGVNKQRVVWQQKK